MADAEITPETTPRIEMMGSDITETNDFVIVDLQGFRTIRNRFIVKEFCLLDGDYKFHALVKSPFSFKQLPSYYQRIANWLTKNFHGLTFDCGDINVNELINSTYPHLEGKKILVKGAQKIQWLQYLFRKCGEIDCVNVEDFGFNTIDITDQYYDVCYYHNNLYGWSDCHCALSNALKLHGIRDKVMNHETMDI